MSSLAVPFIELKCIAFSRFWPILPISAAAWLLLHHSHASVALMVVAMMLPLLRRQLEHVWTRSLAHRRLRALGLFAGVYVLAWSAAMTVIGQAASHVIAEVGDATVALALAGCAAATWQLTPVKRACLARCHALPRLRAFGLAAEIDSLRFGAASAGACIGSCWLLMALPLFAREWHLAAMMGVLLLTMRERILR
jgi:predicted metal-binding membrane protein